MIEGPRRRAFVALAVLAAVFVAATSVAPGVAAAAPRPALLLSTKSASPGDTITVRGVNWPKSTSVTVSVCGNGTKARTADCDLQGAVTTTGDEQGTLSATLVLGVPPSPCPCTVRAATPGSDSIAATPLLLSGAPFQALPTPTAPTGPEVKIEKVALDGGSSIGTWFGGSADRTLVLTVHNRSDSTVASAPVFVDVGRSSNGEAAKAAVTLRSLDPDERRTVRIPVTVDGPTFGRYVVSGRVGTEAAASPFSAKTSSYPWGLLLVVLLAVQAVLLLGRNRARRHLAVRGVSASSLPAVAPTATAEPLVATPARMVEPVTTKPVPPISWRAPAPLPPAVLPAAPPASPVELPAEGPDPAGGAVAPVAWTRDDWPARAADIDLVGEVDSDAIDAGDDVIDLTETEAMAASGTLGTVIGLSAARRASSSTLVPPSAPTRPPGGARVLPIRRPGPWPSVPPATTPAEEPEPAKAPKPEAPKSGEKPKSGAKKSSSERARTKQADVKVKQQSKSKSKSKSKAKTSGEDGKKQRSGQERAMRS